MNRCKNIANGKCSGKIEPDYHGGYCNECLDKKHKKIQEYYEKKDSEKREYYSVCRI